MRLRSFRSFLLFACLLGSVVVSSILVVRATPPATHAKHTFLASGHGISRPQIVYTANMSHKKGTTLANTSLQPATSRTSTHRRASQPLPAPPNVVSVPAPTSTDPSAKNGIFQQGGKPDATGTGGPDNYLETTDSGLAIYSRGGKQQSMSSYQSWFQISSPFYDPVTIWDDTGGRIMFTALQTTAAKIWLSVAQQTNAQGKYCNYSFPTPSGHDFPKLGVDGDGIYLSINVLAPGTNNVVSNELFFAGRVALENCQNANYTDWTALTNPGGSIAQAITPARQDSNSGNAEYLVNSYPLGACQLTLWTLTSSGKLSNTSVPTQCYSPPPQAKQKGSSALIGTSDCSITQASYVNGLLTLDTPGAYDWGDGNGPVSIVEWYVLNPKTASVSNQGAFGTPGYWLFYPSTITTANGHMLFLYSASGASIYPSVWYVNQTMKNPTALANGTTYYGTTGSSPWGDYQSAWPDTNIGFPNSVWITGEYAKSSNTWGTKFDLVTP